MFLKQHLTYKSGFWASIVIGLIVVTILAGFLYQLSLDLEYKDICFLLALDMKEFNSCMNNFIDYYHWIIAPDWEEVSPFDEELLYMEIYDVHGNLIQSELDDNYWYANQMIKESQRTIERYETVKNFLDMMAPTLEETRSTD